MNRSLVRSPIHRASTNAETCRLRNLSIDLRWCAMYNNGDNIRWTRSIGREKFAGTFGSRKRNCGFLGCCCDIKKLGRGKCWRCKSAAWPSNSINRTCAQSHCPHQRCPQCCPQSKRQQHHHHQWQQTRTRNRKSIRKNIRESELNVGHLLWRWLSRGGF